MHMGIDWLINWLIRIDNLRLSLFSTVLYFQSTGLRLSVCLSVCSSACVTVSLCVCVCVWLSHQSWSSGAPSGGRQTSNMAKTNYVVSAFSAEWHYCPLTATAPAGRPAAGWRKTTFCSGNRVENLTQITHGLLTVLTTESFMVIFISPQGDW